MRWIASAHTLRSSSGSGSALDASSATPSTAATTSARVSGSDVRPTMRFSCAPLVDGGAGAVNHGRWRSSSATTSNAVTNAGAAMELVVVICARAYARVGVLALSSFVCGSAPCRAAAVATMSPTVTRNCDALESPAAPTIAPHASADAWPTMLTDAMTASSCVGNKPSDELRLGPSVTKMAKPKRCRAAKSTNAAKASASCTAPSALKSTAANKS
mmetsp:Transcript_39208/g.121175  ORF Transcript_39208/g.121175 Transcript_39208/m.121175 type:complete len:216 (+) Transcript_39208:454-1101(+)